MRLNALSNRSKFILLSIQVVMGFGCGVFVASVGQWDEYGVVIGGLIVLLVALFNLCSGIYIARRYPSHQSSSPDREPVPSTG